ncbi:MAG: DNA repair protein RecO [Gammaproteobacteria bacterium AqS3]|nr:DNA repair protein RecO [Gammaproteobacteria bacterium AqS3]
MRALVPGYVLHRRPWRETSWLLDLWSAEGRTVAIAKGARAPRSRWSALLEPFQPLLLQWSGRGEVHTLTEAEWVDAAAAPLSGRAGFCGLYANELLLRTLLPGEAHTDLFADYGDLMAELRSLPAEPEISALELPLRRFELRLLGALGYALDLQRCSGGEPIAPAGHYHFVPGTGLCRSPSASSDAFAGEALLALGRCELPDLNARRTAKQLLRTALRPLLGSAPLFSRALFTAPGQMRS